MNPISIHDFQKVELRIGTIIEAVEFKEAKKPAYKLIIDLGPEIGIKKSSAQITQKYQPESLIGQQVLCVCNFPPLQIGPFISEVLTTGVNDETNQVILVQPTHPVPNGARLY